MKILLALYAIIILVSSAYCASWEKPQTIENVTEWHSAGLGATLRLTKEYNQSGAFYKLDLIQKDGKMSDVSMPGSDYWIDNSWAGLAWLSDAEFAWFNERYIFFQSDSSLAIFDIQERCFQINNQTEFLTRIGEFRWLYIAYRGKNIFSDSDALGIIGFDFLTKTNISVPSGFKDAALINRIGRSVIVNGLLIAPPVPGPDGVWLLVASKASNVTLQQYKIPSFDRLSSKDVTSNIPNLEDLIKKSREGNIPKTGSKIFDDLLPVQKAPSWEKAADWFLNTNK